MYLYHMTPYGQLLRFHSVAEFSSYCTSVLSLSYNASSTKYSTCGFHLIINIDTTNKTISTTWGSIFPFQRAS